MYVMSALFTIASVHLILKLDLHEMQPFHEELFKNLQRHTVVPSHPGYSACCYDVTHHFLNGKQWVHTCPLTCENLCTPMTSCVRKPMEGPTATAQVKSPHAQGPAAAIGQLDRFCPNCRHQVPPWLSNLGSSRLLQLWLGQNRRSCSR